MLLFMTTTLPSDLSTLADTARCMTHDGRGILAADESIKTMSSRLEQGRARPHGGTTASC
jgi:fructose-bisphosphate aldolase class I